MNFSALYLEHQPIGIRTSSIATRRLDSEADGLNSSGEASIEQGLRKHDDNSPSSDLHLRLGKYNGPVVAAQHHLIRLITMGQQISTFHHKPKLHSYTAAANRALRQCT